jgi:nitric oxide reductase NorQ protein
MNHEPESATTRRGQILWIPAPAGRTALANREDANEPWCGRTDGRRQITVKAHKGETITAADGFYVIAGHNPGVHGAVLTDALASRFSVQIQVGTDFDLAHALKIDSRAIRVARNLATRQNKGEIGWAPQLRELIAFGKIADVLGMDAAAANLTGIAPEEDRDVVTDVVTTVFGRPMVPLALGRQI